ncbi:mCG147069 [Mus musculus]|nr:mCG147069 [Mus musculus]
MSKAISEFYFYTSGTKRAAKIQRANILNEMLLNVWRGRKHNFCECLFCSTRQVKYFMHYVVNAYSVDCISKHYCL